MGDVVNTASRLQTSAPIGGLVVGEETYRATRNVIRYQELEPIDAKGKRDPVEAWLALAPIGAPRSGRRRRPARRQRVDDAVGVDHDMTVMQHDIVEAFDRHALRVLRELSERVLP